MDNLTFDTKIGNLKRRHSKPRTSTNPQKSAWRHRI